MKLAAFLMILPAMATADMTAQPLDAMGFDTASNAELRLGQLLFYDPILSGNNSVACSTCHHPRFATSDGVALGIGDGGLGLGPDRKLDPNNLPEQRIPRNSPALFNLGHSSIRALFMDGRIEQDATRPSVFRTPLEDDMVQGFDGILSAQTMFPVLSADEMAGHYQENEIAQAVRQGFLTGPDGAWNLIAKRVAAVPEYLESFEATYPEIAAGRPIAFTDISNAIAAFISFEWRADNSAFDQHLNGTAHLKGDAATGMDLFFGAAGCSACHSGPLLSDQKFYAMGEPQLGPGKAASFEDHQRDVGRMRVTGLLQDAYAFRTPMLRNVTETGPWGHAGAHDQLDEFLRYHVDPLRGLDGFDTYIDLPVPSYFSGDWVIMGTPNERAAIADAVHSMPLPSLDDSDFDALLAFLGSLRDEASLAGRLGVPVKVPSGLPVE